MIVFPTDHSEEERKFLLAAQNSERAKTILNKLPKPKRAAVSPAFKQKMDRADRIEDLTERLMHQGVIAVWFAANREEATASLTARALV